DQTKRQFQFVAYYTQAVSFPNLFARLIGSPTLRRISDELEGGKEKRIHKQDWKARTELPFEIGAANVLYLLLDSKAKLIYIGEARDMVRACYSRIRRSPIGTTSATMFCHPSSRRTESTGADVDSLPGRAVAKWTSGLHDVDL